MVIIGVGGLLVAIVVTVGWYASAKSNRSQKKPALSLVIATPVPVMQRHRRSRRPQPQPRLQPQHRHLLLRHTTYRDHADHNSGAAIAGALAGRHHDYR